LFLKHLSYDLKAKQKSVSGDPTDLTFSSLTLKLSKQKSYFQFL